jgi:hypothetical protein
MKIKGQICGTIVVFVIFLAGCNPVDGTKSFEGLKPNNPKITNGTCVLIFPEWKASDSAFERKVYTNYYEIYSNDTWLVREQQADGSLAKFFKKDTPSDYLGDVKMSFGFNIQWNIYKAMYDSLVNTNKEIPFK